MLTHIQNINTFGNFIEITKNMKLKEKGDSFEELTKYIFQYHPQYSNFTKNVWLLNETPLELLQQLNMPIKDQGIDLVLQDVYNKYHAIQCKFRTNPDTIIAWRELGTFYGLAFGVAKGFSAGFLVTNTSEITANAVNSDKVIPLYGDFFTGLTNDFFDKLRSVLIPTVKFNPVVPMPRAYQEDMIKKARTHFVVEDRGKIEAACGTGKTLTTYWINQKLFNKITVVAVPSLFLLSQFYKDWTKQMYLENKRASYILVGSDADCDDVKFENNGLIVTTSPQEIADKINHIRKTERISHKSFYRIIIITTYQSSDKLIAGLKLANVWPDLCIFDEAHKTVGQTGKQFNLLLDNANIKIKKRLFVTATPKVYNGNVEDDKVLSMDDEKWYGSTIAVYNTSDAIRDGFLVDYQIVTMYTDDNHINNMVKENKYIWYNSKIVDSNYMATAIMLLNQFKKGDCNHLVTYHNSVIGSKTFRDLLGRLNESYKLDIKLFNVDGNHSMKRRNRIFKEFTESKLAILVSARVLNEGVNIPIIDSVCFVDPRNSTIDIIQCFGRALRLYDGKKMAKIYVPVIIDDIMKIDENKIFGNLIRILKCLSETDANINDYFEAIKNKKICDRKLIRHDNCLSIEKTGDDINTGDWINSVDCKIWYKVNSWKYRYDEIKRWIGENRRSPMQRGKTPEEVRLGKLCTNLRMYKKNGKLPLARIIELEALEGWYWELDSSIDKNYEELKQWIEENDRIPKSKTGDKTETHFEYFCSHIRQNYKLGKLTPEEIHRFELLNHWYWERATAFDGSYDKLKQCIELKDGLPYHDTKDANELKLYTFCHNQRKKKKQGKMSAEHIHKFEELNHWFWEADGAIEKHYDKLAQWIVTYDRLPRQHSKNKEEHALAVFCMAQRLRKDKLTAEQVEKLSALKHWYW